MPPPLEHVSAVYRIGFMLPDFDVPTYYIGQTGDVWRRFWSDYRNVYPGSSLTNVKVNEAIVNAIDLGGGVMLDLISDARFAIHDGPTASLDLSLKHVRHMLEGLALCEAIAAGYEARLLNES